MARSLAPDARSPQPKVRTRAGGSAAPLDDADRRLLNAMQGRFPIAPRPYAAVAAHAELSEDRNLTTNLLR